MSPAAFWASVISAGVVLVTCLLVFQATLTWAVGLTGVFLIVPALAYRPRPFPFESADELDEGER